MSAGGTNARKNPDGSVTYVIGAGSQEGAAPWIEVGTIAERNALVTNRIVFVTKAYEGDASVNKGWAAYILTTSGWKKIVEQESVDGPWGVAEEIKKSLVTHSQFERLVNGLNQTIEQFRQIVDEAGRSAHTHSNKDTLDGLSNHHGILKYRGVPVNTTYLYDVIEDGVLKWRNPTDAGAEVETVESSKVIASRFASTPMAAAGITISVVEVDGAISSFVLTKRGSALVPEFVGVTGGPNGANFKGVVEATALPQPSVEYSNGLYRIVQGTIGYSGGVNGVPGHVYRCMYNSASEQYEWRDLVANPIVETSVGSSIIYSCHKLDWNTSIIVFESDMTTSDLGNPVMSVVVRSYDRPALNINEGTVVGVVYGDSGKVKDVCPLSNRFAYYTVFQFLGNGVMIAPDSKLSRFLSWNAIGQILDDRRAGEFFEIGDEFILEHTAFGAIPFAVIKIDDETGDITISATKKIIDLEFDGVEQGMVKTSDVEYTQGRSYYICINKEVDGVNKEVYEQLEAGVDFEYGAAIENPEGIVDNSDGGRYNEAYDPINLLRHGRTDWATSNLKQWLTSSMVSGSSSISIDDYAWYDENTSRYDELGKSYLSNPRTQDGFLAGFTDVDLRLLIKEVRIPQSASEVVAHDRIWSSEVIESQESEGGITYTHKRLKVYNNLEAEEEGVDPEGDNRQWFTEEVDGSMVLNYSTDYIGVAPVIVLGYTRPE